MSPVPAAFALPLCGMGSQLAPWELRLKLISMK